MSAENNLARTSPRVNHRAWPEQPGSRKLALGKPDVSLAVAHRRDDVLVVRSVVHCPDPLVQAMLHPRRTVAVDVDLDDLVAAAHDENAPPVARTPEAPGVAPTTRQQRRRRTRRSPA